MAQNAFRNARLPSAPDDADDSDDAEKYAELSKPDAGGVDGGSSLSLNVIGSSGLGMDGRATTLSTA